MSSSSVIANLNSLSVKTLKLDLKKLSDIGTIRPLSFKEFKAVDRLYKSFAFLAFNVTVGLLFALDCDMANFKYFN